jgi:hypothetical protein
MNDQAQIKVADKNHVKMAAAAWEKAKKALDRAKDAENKARAELVAAAFPNGLDEGTNTFNLEGKWNLKISGVVDRKVDAPALPAVLERMKLKFPDIDTSDLVKYKPEISVKEYKELVKREPKAAKLFDNALIIRGTGETSPQVKIEESKR